MNWIIPWEALDPSSVKGRHHRRNSLGYVNQKSAAVNRGSTATGANASAVSIDTNPTNLDTCNNIVIPTNSGDKNVVFEVDTPSAISPERQFLLTGDVEMFNPEFEKDTTQVPPIASQSSKVTFGLPTQLKHQHLQQKKRFSYGSGGMRSMFKISTVERHSPPLTPQAYEDAVTVIESGSGVGGVSNFLKRQQRYSRKSEAPSQEDSNSGASGSAGGGVSGGGVWMTWLGGSGMGGTHKKSATEFPQFNEKLSEKRRRKFSTKRLVHSKPKRKKSSFAWDGGFMNNKSLVRNC